MQVWAYRYSALQTIRDCTQKIRDCFKKYETKKIWAFAIDPNFFVMIRGSNRSLKRFLTKTLMKQDVWTISSINLNQNSLPIIIYWLCLQENYFRKAHRTLTLERQNYKEMRSVNGINIISSDILFNRSCSFNIYSFYLLYSISIIFDVYKTHTTPHFELVYHKFWWYQPKFWSENIEIWIPEIRILYW